MSIQEGWLWKKSQWVKSWRRRYVWMFPTQLYIARGTEMRQAHMCLDLLQIKRVDLNIGGSSKRFSVTIGGIVFHFRADDDDSKRLWINVFRILQKEKPEVLSIHDAIQRRMVFCVDEFKFTYKIAAFGFRKTICVVKDLSDFQLEVIRSPEYTGKLFMIRESAGQQSNSEYHLSVFHEAEDVLGYLGRIEYIGPNQRSAAASDALVGSQSTAQRFGENSPPLILLRGFERRRELRLPTTRYSKILRAAPTENGRVAVLVGNSSRATYQQHSLIICNPSNGEIERTLSGSCFPTQGIVMEMVSLAHHQMLFRNEVSGPDQGSQFYLLDLQSEQCIRVFDNIPLSHRMNCIAKLTARSFVSVAEHSQTLYLWNLDTNTSTSLPSPCRSSVENAKIDVVAVIPVDPTAGRRESHKVICGTSGTGELFVWNTETNSVEIHWTAYSGEDISMLVCPTFDRVVVGCPRQGCQVWNLASGEALNIIQPSLRQTFVYYDDYLVGRTFSEQLVIVNWRENKLEFELYLRDLTPYASIMMMSNKIVLAPLGEAAFEVYA